MNLKNTKKQREMIIFVMIFLLGILICYSVKNIFSALLGTLVFFTILRPFQIYLESKKKWNGKWSAIILLSLSVITIIIPVTGLTSMVVSRLSTLQFHHINIDSLLVKLDHITPFEVDYKGIFEDFIKGAANFISNFAPTLIAGAFGFFLNLVIVYFLLYFMLVNRETFEQTIVKYMPFNREDTLLFASEMRNTTYSNVLGQGVIAIVQGILTGLGFWIFGYEDSLFWGVITVFISFVPVLGPPLIFIPAALYQIIDGQKFEGYGLLIFGLIIIMNIDNVLRFVIAKKIADTHPIITVIGVIIGVPLFGILGLVFGPLLLSYFVLLIRVIEKNKEIGKSSDQ